MAKKKRTTFKSVQTVAEWEMSKFFQRKPKLDAKIYEADWDQIGETMHQSWSNLGFKIGIKQQPTINQEENMSPETASKINAVVDSGVSAAKAVSSVAKDTANNAVSSVKDVSVKATDAVKLTALKAAIKVMPVASAVSSKAGSMVSSGVEKSKQLWQKLTSKKEEMPVETPPENVEPVPVEEVKPDHKEDGPTKVSF